LRQLNIRSPSARHYVAKEIAKNNNRGFALRDKVYTVLTELREMGVKHLGRLTQEHVQELIESWRERLAAGELSRSATSTYVSALNRILEYAGRENWTVSAKAEGLNRGSYEYKDRSVSHEAHQAFKAWLEQKAQQTGDAKYEALRHSIELQRELGLRARESFGIKIADKNTGRDTLNLGREDWTKNARPREVPISESAREALKAAQEFAKEQGWKSLTPPDTKLDEYRNWAYRTVEEFGQETGYKDYHFHGERHAFAQEMYSKLWEERGYTVEAPVKDGGSSLLSVAEEIGKEEAKEIDREIRLQVSEALGHGREEITRVYVGPSPL